MKIQIASDLHLELTRSGARCAHPTAALARTDADVLILAGDIDTGARGVEWAASRQPGGPQAVIYVPGNHEFYGQEYFSTLRGLREAAERHGIHLLLNEARIIGGVRFLGSTLWTSFEAQGDAAGAMRAAAYAPNKAGGWMEDYRRIRFARGGSYPRLKPMDTAALHHEAASWLRAELAKSHDGPTVVVTHHAPSIAAVPRPYRDDALAPAYWSPLEDLMELANVWICGHTHQATDARINGCRLLSNPRGYSQRGVVEVNSYRPSWVIDLSDTSSSKGAAA